ncbi:MAG TPA: sulfatase [Mycobacterium sp.]|jgi:arylsulfatase A-like enzyme|nr:sulfatase [Mycobacterium sp.]
MTLSRPAAAFSLAVAAVAAAAVAFAAAPAAHPSPTDRDARSTAWTGPATLARPASVASPATSTSRPNIVFVLTDDLSNNLVQYMPHVQQLAAAGMSFTNYTVTDSLCCPSRSSIFTGEFPHNDGVFANEGPDGGFGAFQANHDEAKCFAPALKAAGYRTAFMGKYLNLYKTNSSDGTAAHVGTGSYIPPGWTTWAGQDNGYPEFNYTVNYNDKLLHYGSRPAEYGVYTLDHFGQRFITDSAAARKPFLLEVASFAPHKPYTPAVEDQNSFPGLQAPRTPAWNSLPANAPSWLAGKRRLSQKAITQLDASFRLRVQSVQSVDRMIGHLTDTLRKTGQLANTVFVFSSDNGYHMGQYRLHAGKMSAFDTDVNVPLVVAGPGIPAGTTSDAVTQNTDLAPTFERLAGITPHPTIDGRSLLPLLHGGSDAHWRTLALVEHHGVDFAQYPNDPDFQPPDAGGIPTYAALRSATFTYVRYQNGEREYYNRASDPYELNNIAASLPATRIDTLDAALDALQACKGTTQCWAAGHLDS